MKYLISLLFFVELAESEDMWNFYYERKKKNFKELRKNQEKCKI